MDISFQQTIEDVKDTGHVDIQLFLTVRVGEVQVWD